MRRLQAIITAILISGIIGAAMWTVGVDAAINALELPGSTTTAGPAPEEVALTVPDQANAQQMAANQAAADQAAVQVAQLKDVVAQYQNREKQYQQQLDEATQKLAQANQQIQQYQAQMNDASQRLAAANQQIQQFQSALTELQRRGLIRIGQDGTISLPRR